MCSTVQSFNGTISVIYKHSVFDIMKSTYWTIGAVIAATIFSVFFSPILYLTSFLIATLFVFYVFILIVSDGDITLMLYEQFGNNGGECTYMAIHVWFVPCVMVEDQWSLPNCCQFRPKPKGFVTSAFSCIRCNVPVFFGNIFVYKN